MKQIKAFFKNCMNPNTKYFWIYMCIDFASLINGLILVAVGRYPAIIDLPPNEYRLSIGYMFIIIWFVFLPQVPPKSKKAFLFHAVFSGITVMTGLLCCLYWMKTASVSALQKWDFLVLGISIIATSHLLYCTSNLVRVFFLLLRRIISRILPARDTAKSGLIYTLEAITSILAAVSSFIAAVWGIVNAVEKLYF